MKKIKFASDILPHLVAIIVFAVITALFFAPAVLENKVLAQHDIDQWLGGANELIQHREKTGEEGLWTNSMFGGMPAYFVNTEWDDKPVTFLKKVISLGFNHPVNNIFVAFICFYIMLLSFGVRPYLAIGGAIAFGLSSFNIIGLAAGHNARIGAIAVMPLLIAGVHLVYTRSRLLGFGIATAATALQLMESHLQITYYLLLILVIYAIIQLVDFYKKRKLKSFFICSGICIIAAIIGITAYAGRLWSTWEYSQYSMRGPSELSAELRTNENEGGLAKDYAFQYSNGIFEPLTLMIPNILGGSSSNILVQDEDSDVLQVLRTANDPNMANQLAQYTRAYWGDQPLTAPYYVGAISCFLFALGFAFAKKKYVVWLSIVAFLGIVLSWGSNFQAFNYFMFDYFPGYNKFRSVTFTILMPIFAIPFLGMLGLENLIREGFTPAIRKKFFICFGVVAGICLLIAIISGLFSYTRAGEEQLPQWFLKALRSDRQDLLLSDVFRSLLFIVLASVLIYLYKLNRLGYSLMAGLLILFIAIDLYVVDKRFFGEENFRRQGVSSFTQQLPVDQAILRDQDLNYRVYNLQGAWSEARTSYFHNSIGGYHGAKLRRIQDLYDYCLENETMELINNLRSGQRALNEYGILNMLNARYLVFGSEANNVISNEAALGNAWPVNEVVEVASADQALLKTCEINPATSAVVDTTKFDLPKLNFTATGQVTLQEYAPNKLSYNANLTGESLVVFSEIYYPAGWKAEIDGNPVEIVRANYVLRALVVPQGQHTITFTFEPDAYVIGNKITMAGSWLVILVLIGSIGGALFRHLKQPHTDQ